MIPRAHFGSIPIARARSVLMSHSFAGCVSMARSTFPTFARRMISRGWVPPATPAPSWPFPFVRRENSLEYLSARRTEVRPFTPAQIKLLETFADQAVIAIENVRLFQELKERWSSKRRRAKSWVSSPARRRIFSLCWTPLPKTLRRLCDANDAAIRAFDGDVLRSWPHYGSIPCH